MTMNHGQPPVHAPSDDDESLFGGFHNLMPHRIDDVLLVSSLYESFILEEDGLVGELITSEFHDLNLSNAPRVRRVAETREALETIQRRHVDLVITLTGPMRRNLAEFGAAAKRVRPDVPVVVLADDAGELLRQPQLRDKRVIDRTFVWNGDAKILLAIIKLIEDRLNADADTQMGDVRIIILVENSVRFYSTYLPLIYTELMKLTQSLMAEGVTPMHKLLRMRARPKILLAETYEEACELYRKYSPYLLGVISDVRFPRGGERDPEAGLEFTRMIRAEQPYLPVLLQSSDEWVAGAAADLHAAFLNKRSRTLFRDMRNFILNNLGFGDFVFTLPDGTEVDRAADLRAFEEALARVPEESILFHARNNHFSNWLMARTEFELASRIRPRKVSDFASIEDVRRYLISTLAEFREKSRAGVVTRFSPGTFDASSRFTRIGGGSIGGKARGLAFINALIRRHNLHNRFEGVRIAVPTSAVLGTEVFDAFIEENRLHRLLSEDVPDEEVVRICRSARMPGGVLRDLAAFLRLVRFPLAVRSSSLLEDSHDRPFAGIYETYMIPNNHPDLDVRLDQMFDAIKLVYASTWRRAAKRYLEATGRQPEEEKMGVILQEIVGSAFGDRFYPTFSGVARSYNFYPTPEMSPQDGVAAVALGLGKTVVEGGACLLFSPTHPHILPQYPTTQDLLAHSQREFFALNLTPDGTLPVSLADANLVRLGLDVAEQDGTLAPLGSVYSPENDMVYDGIFRSGPRLVTFAHVLKAGLFPLADALRLLLDLAGNSMGCPVEIEFAVDMTTKPMEFGFLQVRPIISDEESDAVRVGSVTPDEAICFSTQSLGHGRMGDLSDIVYVKPEQFDSAHTTQIAAEVARINESLRQAERACVLIGPGRWGTADRWLGIPVTWEQISSARVIVETTLQNFVVTPSQGTHFFQNLTSLRVGYLTVDPATDGGFIDWSWLDRQPSVTETEHLRHVRLARPLAVRLDGRTRRGAIFKPDAKSGY